MNSKTPLYLSLFALGFFPARFSLLIIVPTFLFTLFFGAERVKINFNLFAHALYTIILLYLIYAVFWYRLHEFSAVPMFFYMGFVCLFFIFVILILGEKNNSKKSFISFSLGIYCSILVTCVYSIFWKNIYVGVGSVFNPLFGSEPSLSPVWSNMLALALVVIILLMDDVRFKFVFLLLGLAMGLYLGGRTFFIIIGLTLLSTQNLRVVLTFMLAVTGFFVVITFFVGSEYIDSLVSVFELKGLDSTRYLHWRYAYENFQNYPFGGMLINQDIEEIGSFHNIFIDIYCFGGVPLLVVFLTHLSITISGVFQSFKKMVMLVMILLVLMQDSVIEGGIRLFFFYLFFSIIVVYQRSVYRSGSHACLNEN